MQLTDKIQALKPISVQLKMIGDKLSLLNVMPQIFKLYMAVPFLFFAIIVTIIVLKSALVVPEGKAFILERLGKFQKILTPGFHIIVPVIDRVIRVSTEPQSIVANGVEVNYSISDLLKSNYSVANLSDSINNLVATALNKFQVPSQVTSLDKSRYEADLFQFLKNPLSEWGCALHKVSLLR